jgi:hypothetical protein
MQHEITCQQSENAEGNAEASESLFPLSAMESLGEGQKRCAKCKTLKPTARFASRKRASDGLNSWCRDCKAEANRRYRQTPQGQAKHAEYNRRWRQNPENRAKQSEAARRRYSNPENRAKQADAARRWHQSSGGRDWRSRYVRRRRQTNPQFRLANRLRGRLRQALKGTRKSARTLDMLGCTLEHLIKHLESRFQTGMSWLNQGKWHIDHIRPLASFDLSDPEQQRMACHWTNLQPLWAIDNLRKNDRIIS